MVGLWWGAREKGTGSCSKKMKMWFHLERRWGRRNEMREEGCGEMHGKDEREEEQREKKMKQRRCWFMKSAVKKSLPRRESNVYPLTQIQAHIPLHRFGDWEKSV